jgi:hypothetical protein
MTNELAFKVVRINGTYEVLSRCVNVIIARGAYRKAARMYPDELIELLEQVRHLTVEGLSAYMGMSMSNSPASTLALPSSNCASPSYPSSARPCKSRCTDD